MTKRGQGFKKSLFVSMLLTLTIALGGCAGDKEDGSSTQITTPSTENVQEGESSITIGISQDMNSMDPNIATGAGTREILFNIYEGLYKPDCDGNLVPAVASGYTMSDDGLTYTFTLRDGIKFHNGNPVTVEDIKYSIDKCAGLNRGDNKSAFSIVESTNIIDDKNIEVKITQPNRNFIASIATVEAAIVPADVKNLEETPVGTGPYMYVSRSLQENLVLKKFDEYWGTPAKIENVTCKVFSSADSVLMSLQSGAIDFVSRISTSAASELGNDFNVIEGTSNLVQAMYVNHDVAPFDNTLVRQALTYALNKQEIMDFIADGKGTPVASSMFPAFKKYYSPELNDVYSQDIEKAKELLAQAGYPDGFTFTITVPSNYQPHVDTATVLAEQFKAIGVTANIELVEWESWLSDVYAGRNFEATVVGVDASNLTADAMLGRFESTASNNFTNYKNADYDATYQKAAEAKDEEESTKYYKECEKILCEDACNIYIQDMALFTAMNKKYTGYVAYPLYVLDLSTLDYAK